MTSMSNSLTGFSSALSAVTGMIYCFPLCSNRTEPTLKTSLLWMLLEVLAHLVVPRINQRPLFISGTKWLVLAWGSKRIP
ncbi:hypothetical protein Hanom_Chr04g00288911 [Helianthus anomalus]